MSSIARRIQKNMTVTGRNRRPRGHKQTAFTLKDQPRKDFGLLGRMVASLVNTYVNVEKKAL